MTEHHRPDHHPDPEAHAAKTAEHINDLTVHLFGIMIKMGQALIDAATRAATSEQTAASTIASLASTNASQASTISSLTQQLADAQAGAGDPAAEQSAADNLNSQTDALDAAVSQSQAAG